MDRCAAREFLECQSNAGKHSKRGPCARFGFYSDPQFAHRLPFYGIDDVGAEQLPLPVYIQGQLPPTPTMAPGIGEQTDEVLAELGISAERIAELRAAGSVGPQG